MNAGNCLFLFLILSCYSLVFGQNIVADPSFEGWTGSNNGGNTLDGMTDWYNANGTSDLHHTSRNPGTNLTGLNPCPLGNGDSSCGTAVSGEGVMGCYKGNGEDGSKEWAGVRLLEATVPGDCYEISFWVQNKKDRPGSEYVTNQWGVFFSETEQPQFNPNLFDFDRVSSQWVATDEVIDGNDWHFIELNFQADEVYEYLFVGFMGNAEDATQRIANNDQFLGCYVFFDDLYVNHVDVEVPPTITICAGDEATIDFASDFSLNWTDGNISDTTRSFVVAPLATTTYYVTATGNTGCTKIDSVTVEVEFPTNSTLPDDLCTYSEAIIVDADAGAGRWVGPGIEDIATGRFSAVLAGPGQHTVFFLSDAGCAASASYTINVRDVTPPQMSVDAVSGCTPLTISVGQAMSTDPAMEYRWTFGDTTIISTDPNATYTFYQGGEYEVSADLVYSPSCIVTSALPAAIQVNQSPVADFITAGRLTNLDGATTFSDRSEGEIAAWDWDIAGIASSSRNEAYFEFNEAGRFEVFLEVTDQTGCTDTSRQVITVMSEAKVFVPNAFSPNGDGVNDRFELGIAGRIEEFQLEIYNRWGGIVFASDDPDLRWDGIGRNGDLADVGTYLFSLSYRAEDLEGGEKSAATLVAGNILLLR